MLAVIHADQRIPWHPIWAQAFADGLKAVGVRSCITESRTRLPGDFPILLGTTCWRAVERDGGDYLLVDRCSFGPADKFVTLVWNGHGRRGDHRVPSDFDASRWQRYGVDLVPWADRHERVVLCGQVEAYSPHYTSLDAWYQSVAASGAPTHFRPHPASQNYTRLATARNFDNAIAVTLNSSVAVQAVMAGVPTITMDEGAMAWDVTGHSLDDIRKPDRLPWCHWLAWTQWSDDEIREGVPWAYHL